VIAKVPNQNSRTWLPKMSAPGRDWALPSLMRANPSAVWVMNSGGAA
jgi:hypothetical protein